MLPLSSVSHLSSPNSEDGVSEVPAKVSPKRHEQVIQKFERRRLLSWVSVGVLFVFFQVVFVNSTRHGSMGDITAEIWWLPVSVFVFLIIARLLLWRCPACKSSLGMTINPKLWRSIPIEPDFS